MENLLPKFQSFSLSDDGPNHPSQWKPQEAVVAEKSRRFQPSQPPPKKTYQTDILPPNQRYQEILHENDDFSPLSAAERGVVEKPKMQLSFSKGPKQEPIYEKISSPVSIMNGNIISIQLFYQNLRNVFDLPLAPGDTEIRFPNGKLPKEDSQLSTFEIYLATARRLSVVMSLKQQLQTHLFQPGSIGIEVEMKNNQLLCTRVFEGSQAAPYSDDLLHSTIVAINGTRVITLNEFRNSLMEARELGIPVKLLVISQLGEDEVLDDLITFHKKSRKMARLVSGAFEEASEGEMSDDYASKGEVQIYDNISLDPKETYDDHTSVKKGGMLDLDDDARGGGRAEGLDSKYSSRSESCESIYVDPAEQAAVTAQVSNLSNPRRATIVESIEYLQEIGNSIEMGDEMSVKRSESKVLMPTLAEGDDGDEEKSTAGAGEVNDEEGVADVDLAPGKTENSVWNYATALDENDVTSHRHLVCVPKSLNSSRVWGQSNPSRACMHIANYSQSWQLDVSWVGEDCGLVSRAVLNAGDTHVELMSHDHVWCLTVSKRSVPIDSAMRLQVDEAGNFPDDVPDISSTSFLYRPPSTEHSTHFSPACSVTWIPWHSVAMSECSKQQVNSNLGDETIDLFVKVFDSTKSNQKASQRRVASRKK